MGDCRHREVIQGRCSSCGLCLHELVLNGACYYCGRSDIETTVKSADELVPASRLTNRDDG